MSLSPALRQTIAYASSTPDDRGLLPLAEARALLAAADIYPGAPVHKGRDAVEAERVRVSHEIHAALVSLESADEALDHLTRLVWGLPLYDATTLVERYGARVLPWIAGTVEQGTLVAKAWCLEEALVRLGSEEAFDVLLRVHTIKFEYAPRVLQVGDLAGVPELDRKARVDIRVLRAIDAFIAEHPAVAARVIGRRLAGAPKEKRWKELVKLLPETPEVARALGVPRPVEPITAKGILAVLDAAARSGSLEAWPAFATGIEDDPAGQEYHALRLIAARSASGPDWGVVLQRISGSYSRWDPARVETFLYGSRVRDAGRASVTPLALVLDRIPDEAHGETLPVDLDGVTLDGPAGPVDLSDAFAETHALKPGWGTEYEGDAGFNVRLRGYLAAHPRAFWEPAEAAAAALSIPDVVVLVDTDAFAHVVGSVGKLPARGASFHGLPSASQTYRSLAEALVARDATRFAAGEPNVDWRIHAVNRTEP